MNKENEWEMFIDNHKETEIKWESYRLKLWYCHDVMTSFFSDVLNHLKSTEYNNKNEIKMSIVH